MYDETLSHYDRLGGVEAIRAVDELYARILRDPHLAPYFAGVDVACAKRHQVLLLCALLGGPQNYDGLSLHAAHLGLGVTPADYDRVVDHLEDVLQAAGGAGRHARCRLRPRRRQVRDRRGARRPMIDALAGCTASPLSCGVVDVTAIDTARLQTSWTWSPSTATRFRSSSTRRCSLPIPTRGHVPAQHGGPATSW